MKHDGFNPRVNYGRRLECLKSILCDIKKNLGSTVKHTRLPIIMPILANMCSLLHSFVFGYFKSITSMLAAACVFFKMRRIHNFKSVDPEYTDECVFIRLNRSKTDSFRQGIIIPLF